MMSALLWFLVARVRMTFCALLSPRTALLQRLLIPDPMPVRSSSPVIRMNLARSERIETPSSMP